MCSRNPDHTEREDSHCLPCRRARQRTFSFQNVKNKLRRDKAIRRDEEALRRAIDWGLYG